MKRRLAFVIAFVTLAVVVSSRFAAVAYADGEATTGSSIVEQVGCDETVVTNGVVGVNRACQVTDFINLFIYLSKWGMSILAVLATGMLIYGGFSFLIAGGRASKVDEGKRVLTGTIVGTMIALTAYVLINTTVAAVSGTTINNLNPFGVIASVFDNPNNVPVIIQGQTSPANLVRPFSGKQTSSGTSGTTTVAACRQDGSGWIRDCSTDKLQVYCADPGPQGGEITTLQKTLVLKGCNCGEADGCYGKQTVACVRQFQIANNLPPSGVIDATTKDRIQNASATCSTNAFDAETVAKLPDTVLKKTEGGDSKCCVVNDGTEDKYCVNGLSTRACGALGSGSASYAGICGSGETAGRCGFCSTNATPTTSNGSRCYMLAAKAWCQAGGMSYFNNACTGNCQTCINSLRVSFP